MGTHRPEETSLVRRQRLEKLLQVLAQQGHSQNWVALQTGVPASYLSNVKNGNRPITELFARRLAEEFHLDYRWLLGSVGTVDSLKLGQEVALGQEPGLGQEVVDGDRESTRLWLPVFLHPIQGPPRSLPEWNGTRVEICGAAADRARAAIEPYVIHFLTDGKADPLYHAPLQNHDLVLISQAVNPHAEIQVVRSEGRNYLALKKSVGHWLQIGGPGAFDAKGKCIGHALGILWRPLG